MGGERLDILIYAHDGRGIGHAGRSATIGMALRRLYPDFRVLLVTGSRHVSSLVGAVPLDWIKLPSYETKIVDGVSKGCNGNSNFSDNTLGQLRSGMLADLVNLLRPRIVLADHMPQGKHKELLPALEASRSHGTRWVLGVRGVVGEVGKVWSDFTADIFRKSFENLLWYGDSSVLGTEELSRLEKHFGRTPYETGYVSRLKEFLHWKMTLGAAGGVFAGTVSFSWVTEESLELAARLAEALRRVGSNPGRWKVFADLRESNAFAQKFRELFEEISHVEVEPFSDRYVGALASSRCAVIFAGYNSLTDVLALNLPSVILLRGMKDNEQELHAANLAGKVPYLHVLSERDDALAFESTLLNLLSMRSARNSVALEGAKKTAALLAGMLAETEG